MKEIDRRIKSLEQQDNPKVTIEALLRGDIPLESAPPEIREALERCQGDEY